MAVENFEELYLEELRDLYSAETQLVKALPKVAKACTTPALKQAVEEHLEVTKGQVQRLEQIFQDMDEKPTGHHCKAMEGLIKESNDTIEEMEEGVLLDAAIIVGAQKIEHYEIAGYGSVRTFAEQLGYDEHIELLQATLTEEGDADDSLTNLAMNDVNPAAGEEDEEAAPEKAASGTKK